MYVCVFGNQRIIRFEIRNCILLLRGALRLINGWRGHVRFSLRLIIALIVCRHVRSIHCLSHSSSISIVARRRKSSRPRRPTARFDYTRTSRQLKNNKKKKNNPPADIEIWTQRDFILPTWFLTLCEFIRKTRTFSKRNEELCIELFLQPESVYTYASVGF